MARQIDLDQLMKYPLRRESALCDEEHADPHFLNGVESVLEWAQTLPTLTPPNEWVEALEAINNAAVAYIEGGPYENDLPGMEFAVEIDRLSRDFVRPPNEWVSVEDDGGENNRSI